MNERINKIGLESGMLNYVDNETPRHYFLSGHADEQDLAKFAELIVRECAKVAVFKDSGMAASADVAGYMAAGRSAAAHMIKQHFGVEE